MVVTCHHLLCFCMHLSLSSCLPRAIIVPLQVDYNGQQLNFVISHHTEHHPPRSAMALPNHLHRKPSTLTPSSLSRANTMCPSTPGSSKYTPDRRHTGLRSLFHKHREGHAQFDMLTPPSSSPTPSPSPVISKLAKAFADSLNATQLSNFLTWMLYYDVVELPDDPASWYKRISNMELRGCVALGDYLVKCAGACVSYGFELVVLDAICDRIRLPRPTVHALLIQFADPEKMKFSSIATTISTAQEDGLSALDTLDIVQVKLHELYKLVVNLKPQEGSRYDEWHGVLLNRIRGFLHLVIGPRIAHLRSGKPLVTAATSEQLPKEVKEGIKLNYLWEAMQEERVVPLSRYGIYQDTEPHSTPPLASSSGGSGDGDAYEETERARNHAIHLMAQNADLRAQITVLEHEKAKLVDSNEKLARKVATLGTLQPMGYLRSPSSDQRPQSLLPRHIDEQPMTLQVPQQPQRPRSLSADTGSKLADSLSAKLDTHKRQHSASDLLSHKYEDVFQALSSSPTLRLSDPVTGREDTPVIPVRNSSLLTSSPMTPVRRSSPLPTRTRRSGMIFERGSLGYLSEIGGTPRIEEEEEEDGGDGFRGTPTPVRGGRFDLLE
jgi:hypothetical protein